jgi:hypothetical protein
MFTFVFHCLMQMAVSGVWIWFSNEVGTGASASANEI